MAFSIRFSWDDFGLADKLRKMQQAGRNLTGLNETLGDVLVSDVQMNFRNESAPDGTPWQQSIRAAIEGGKTLTDSGDLGNSVVKAAGPDYAAAGTNLIYAAIHHSGGEIRPRSAKALRFQLPGGAWVNVGKVTIPARPFIGISDLGGRELVATALRWIQSVTGGQK